MDASQTVILHIPIRHVTEDMSLTNQMQRLNGNCPYKRSCDTAERTARAESLGQLVVLGFDVAVFTPAPYRRPRLGRPSGSPHLADGFALRCFQRLSEPGADTRRCPWRDNRQTGGLSSTVLSY